MPANSPGDTRLARSCWVFATATSAGVVLALLGPFGSYINHGPLLRLGYWVGAMWTGLLFNGVGFMISRKLAAPGSLRGCVVLVGSVLVASIPEALVTRLSAFRLWPELSRIGPDWITWYAQVVTIGLLSVTGTALAVRAFRPPVPPGSIERPAPATPPIASPERLRGDIIALQMEDHYVRIHTVAGSSLILMPLSRAIQSMTVDGIRTHRSWWVARHAVERAEGTPRSMCLRLKNGVVAPVSRSAVANLRAAGWFQAET